MRTVSIIGCGYTGCRLSRRLSAAGIAVRGFATRAASLAQVTAAGALAAELDLDVAAPFDGRAVNFADHVIYYSVPPTVQGNVDLRLERFLAGLSDRPRRIVYLSTTGVYGDHAGGLVDEETPPTPATPRAVRRLAAETALTAWAEPRSVSWCILRVPGIYGPGRLPLDRLRQAQPTIADADAMPTNRIHVDDLVRAAIAAGTSPRADRRIYNITDGSDDSSTAFLRRVARIAGLPQAPEVPRSVAQQTFTAATLSFLNESRRVGNRRMLEDLEVHLAYRDLDAGIRASLDDQDAG